MSGAPAAIPGIVARFEEETPLLLPNAEEWAAFADALRMRPGVWALFGQYSGASGGARQYAYALRNGGATPGCHRVPGAQVFDPPGSFEFTHRLMFGENRIYVRFVGIPGQREPEGQS